MAGRTHKLTSQLAGRICHIIRIGNYAETAAAHAGLAKQTYYNWLRDASRIDRPDAVRERAEYLRWMQNIDLWKLHIGWVPRKPNPPNEPGQTEADRPPAPPALAPRVLTPCLLAFLDAVEKSQAEAEVRDLSLIGAAAVTQWQAAAWRRERMAPQRFGRRERGTGGDGEAVPDPGVVAPSGDALVIFHLPSNGRERLPPVSQEPAWSGLPGEAVQAVPAAPAAASASPAPAQGRPRPSASRKGRKAARSAKAAPKGTKPRSAGAGQ